MGDFGQVASDREVLVTYTVYISSQEEEEFVAKEEGGGIEAQQEESRAKKRKSRRDCTYFHPSTYFPKRETTQLSSSNATESRFSFLYFT